MKVKKFPRFLGFPRNPGGGILCMQNMLDNSSLFSIQLCPKARSPGQHGGVNVLGGTHSSISSQVRTENKKNLLAHPKDTEMEELGSTL